MKTIIYVDGFNLYYRALKGTKHKWLNLSTLCKKALPNNCDITQINYYTARISSRVNPNSPKEQHAYIKALQTLSCLQIHLGRFQVTDKFMFLVQPVEFKPECNINLNPTPELVKVVKTEEKGSDVNLGVHLVRDAFTQAFEHAAIMTNDTDLVEPIRIVTQEANLPITLLTPVNKPATDLKKVSTYIRHIKPYLAASQFLNTIIGQNGEPIHKPDAW